MKTGEIFACNKPGVFNSGPFHMSPVAGLARLEGPILLSVHMGNFSPVTVHMENFSLVTRDEQDATFQASSRQPGWSVHMGKFLARLLI